MSSTIKQMLLFITFVMPEKIPVFKLCTCPDTLPNKNMPTTLTTHRSGKYHIAHYLFNVFCNHTTFFVKDLLKEDENFLNV